VKFNYYPETDSLYIDLSEKISAESKEVSPGIVLDFDNEGCLVGIDIDRASKTIDIKKIESVSLPIEIFTMKPAKPAKTA
jgi:uncharacterized protein YuzE